MSPPSRETLCALHWSRALSGVRAHPVELADIAVIIGGGPPLEDTQLAAALRISVATVRRERRRYGTLRVVGDLDAPCLERTAGTGLRGSRTALRARPDEDQLAWVDLGDPLLDAPRALLDARRDATARALERAAAVERQPVDKSAGGCAGSAHPSRRRQIRPTPTASSGSVINPWGSGGAPQEHPAGSEGLVDGVSADAGAVDVDGAAVPRPDGDGVTRCGSGQPGAREPGSEPVALSPRIHAPGPPGAAPRPPRYGRPRPAPERLEPPVRLPAGTPDRWELLAQADDLREQLLGRRRALRIRRVAPAWQIADALEALRVWLGSRNDAMRCAQGIVRTEREHDFAGAAVLFALDPRRLVRSKWFRWGFHRGRHGGQHWAECPGWYPVTDPARLSAEPAENRAFWSARWLAGQELRAERAERGDRAGLIAEATARLRDQVPGGRIALALVEGRPPREALEVLEAYGDPVEGLRRLWARLQSGSSGALRTLRYLDATTRPVPLRDRGDSVWWPAEVFGGVTPDAEAQVDDVVVDRYRWSA